MAYLKDTIARHLRINKLIPALKRRLDATDGFIRIAVSLSYLRDEEQAIVEEILADGGKISMDRAEALKDASAQGQLDVDFIKGILEQESTPKKAKAVKLSRKMLSRYFNDDQSEKEIEEVISIALDEYFARQ